ncbi:uncharacterized protein LOC120128862 [Hibiscus syriacus]|uniref:uncharacterized protein LOC120128862 n=1 Tax=Hibiscus syriacus TaxID=106335 RepID=UPI001920E265|nr:uncharacterized protein LOC120128862 [Hibiscus syriacus]
MVGGEGEILASPSSSLWRSNEERPSYANMVVGISKETPSLIIAQETDSIVVRDEDCSIDSSGPITKISFSERVHDQINQCMKQVLIIRLLDRSMGCKTLLTRVLTLWKLKGELQLVDMENNYYLAIFTVEENYVKALFRRIAEAVGRVVKIDYNTQAGGCGKFTLLVIIADLNKPLKSCIGIDNFIQQLEYEGLNNICFTCGTNGHSSEVRGKSKGTSMEAEAEIHSVDTRKGPSLEAKGEELYGPWMVVKKRKRKPRVEGEEEQGVQGTIASDAKKTGRDKKDQKRKQTVIDGNNGEIQAGYTLNNAYIASNPGKKEEDS